HPGMRLARAARPTAEQRLEKIAEVLGLASVELAPAELEAGVPARRRSALAVAARLPAPAHLVIGGALLGIVQHLVGLRDLLDACLRILLLAHVRVVLARELAVGALDLVGRGTPFDAEGGVVVLVVHAAAAPGASSRCAARLYAPGADGGGVSPWVTRPGQVPYPRLTRA